MTALILSLLRRYWPFAIIAALMVLLVIDANKLKARDAQLDACSARNAQQVADMRAKTAQAQAADLAHKVDVEAKQDTVTKETANALETQLADARASAAAYAARLRIAAASGASGQRGSDLPVAAGAASLADQAGGLSELDVTTCSVNTIIAAGWQSWWSAQVALAR